MYTFFLMIESPVASDWPAQILENLGHVYRDDGYFLVGAPLGGIHDGWIAISEVEPSMENQENMALVLSMIKAPVRFMVEGRDSKTSFAHQFLLSLDSSLKAVIENEQGCIATVSSFQALAKAGISWLDVSRIDEPDAGTADDPANTHSMPAVL